MNSCGYQIQAQLPATVIPHFAHRRLLMRAIQIFARAPVNLHSLSTFSAPLRRGKCAQLEASDAHGQPRSLAGRA